MRLLLTFLLLILPFSVFAQTVEKDYKLDADGFVVETREEKALDLDSGKLVVIKRQEVPTKEVKADLIAGLQAQIDLLQAEINKLNALP